MNCIKNIYELFGQSGPVYSTDEIWYLGFSPSNPNFPYPGYPQDVILTGSFNEPTVSIGGGPQTDLLSTNFGGFIGIPGHPNSLQGALVTHEEDLDFIIGNYCEPTVDPDDPYLEAGEPTQPGFYFFLRKVINNSCTAFSEVKVLEVGIGAALPDDIFDQRCDTDVGLDCFDITIYVDPAVTLTCMYPPYDISYFDVPDPTCVDISVNGFYTFTYTVPLSALQLVYPVDENCGNCNEDDLTMTIDIIVAPTYQADPILFCN